VHTNHHKTQANEEMNNATQPFIVRHHWKLAQMAGLGGFLMGFAYTMETGKPLFMGEKNAQNIYDGLYNDYRVQVRADSRKFDDLRVRQV